jgi:TRAP-type C4-dicarboxylate transport system substrate-binding protein
MNHVDSKKRLGITIICSIFVVGLLFVYVPQAASAAKVIKWNASLWGGPRGWTYPFERFAKDMERLTNGRWQITLHYGGALAPPKEQLDGIKGGMFEACHFCTAYAPAKLPLHSVMELPFISPHKPLDLSLMFAAMWEHPALLKELERWNAVPLLPGTITTYNLMGNKRLDTVEDFKGARIRIGGEIGRVLTMFGAVPTLMPVPELYESVEKGTVDLAGLPWSFAFGAFKVYEVSKYAIVGLNLGTMACSYIANKKAFNALPEEFKKIHAEWYAKAPYEWGKEYDTLNRKWIDEVFKKRLEFIEFPPDERAKIVKKAQTVWEEWVKKWEKKGLPAREVLDYYLSKRKEIAGY